MKDTITPDFIYPNEYEQASNSYLMSTVCIIAGLPLPVLNVLAAIGFYCANRNASYFVRWHCIQSIISQVILMPFNSILFGWTIVLIFSGYNEPSLYFIIYAFTVLILNLIDFLSVIITAIKISNGNNVRWPLLAIVTDRLTSAQNREKYRL